MPVSPLAATAKLPVASIGAWWAVTFEEPNQPTRREEIRSVVTVGRESGCQVRLAGIGISREHVRLEPAHDGVLLTDLGSTNGTFVNGKRITGTVVLLDGDTVVIGDTTCRVSRTTG